MIVAFLSLIAALIFGGGSMDYYMVSALEKGVKTCISDPEQKKEIINNLKNGRKQADVYYKIRSKNIKELKSLIKNSETTPNEFESFLEKQLNELSKFQTLVFQTRINCLEHISEDEWNCIIEFSDKKTQKIKQKAQKNANPNSFDKVKQSINKHITDETNKEQAIASLSLLQQSYDHLIDELQQRNEIDSPVIISYSSTVEDLEKIAEEINQYRDTLFADLVEFHQSLQSITRADEWDKIIKQLIKSLHI